MQIRHSLTAAGADPFQKWLDALKDVTGRVAILRRVDRMVAGNFGDHKFWRISPLPYAIGGTTNNGGRHDPHTQSCAIAKP